MTSGRERLQQITKAQEQAKLKALQQEVSSWLTVSPPAGFKKPFHTDSVGVYIFDANNRVACDFVGEDENEVVRRLNQED